jgi:hypothetical protein
MGPSAARGAESLQIRKLSAFERKAGPPRLPRGRPYQRALRNPINRVDARRMMQCLAAEFKVKGKSSISINSSARIDRGMA